MTWSFAVATFALQKPYRSPTEALQKPYRSPTEALQKPYRSPTEATLTSGGHELQVRHVLLRGAPRLRIGRPTHTPPNIEGTHRAAIGVRRQHASVCTAGGLSGPPTAEYPPSRCSPW